MKTSKKRSPRSLSSSTNVFNSIGASIDKSQVIIEYELDGTILTANDNFRNALGYSLEELKGRNHKFFCEPSFANSPEYSTFWNRLKDGEFISEDSKMIGKNGKEVWIYASYIPIKNSQGKILKIVNYGPDITQQKIRSAIDRAKLTALDRVQATIEFKTDGTIINANKNFLTILGYELKEIQGKHHRIFCEPSYSSSAEYEQFWDKLNRGEFNSGQYKRIAKSGKEVWIQASYNPIFDENGNIIMIVKFATDFTAQKKKLVEFEGHVTLLEETANSLAGAATELTATAAQMTTSAKNISKESGPASVSSEKVAIAVQIVATNTEELVASIREISRSSNESADMTKATATKAQEANRTVTQLGASSQEIGEVTKVISSIAQQTNLLALNATIEAARAGDAGKGFAVVANEVKELAKQTAKATQDITHKIGAIQSDSQRAVEAISDIAKAIDTLNSISSVIAASVEEQTATTNEVARVVQDASKSVQGISASTKLLSKSADEGAITASQTLEASTGLAKLAEKLKQIVVQVKGD